MSGTTFNPLTSSLSRVFIIEGRARPDHVPSYQACLRSTAISQALGGVEKIECPDPAAYGKYIELGQIKGATERPTFSLEGRFAFDTKSVLLSLARKGCRSDIQIHFGQCQDPRVFTDFTKALILEDAFLTNYSTNDLGALTSGDNAVVNETAEISATEVYETVPLTLSKRADTVVTNEVVDVVICDSLSCGGDCEDESNGCQKIFAITKMAGGSPGTPPDIVYSIDGGSTWYAWDIDTMSAAEDPDAIDCVNEYIVVVSEDTVSLHYALKSEMDGVTDPVWAEVATGFVGGGEPKNLWSWGNGAFIVGMGGYIYKTVDPTAGVTVLDAGVATADDLFCVHGLSESFAVAAGANGTIVWTADGVNWNLLATSPVGAGITINTVWVKSEKEWFIGTDAGLLYYTVNGGATWVSKAFYLSGTGSVLSIVFSTDSIGYLSHQKATTKGQILRTYDSGQSWKVLPDSSGTIPDNDKIDALAACSFDANFVVGVGLGDTPPNGVIIVGVGS